METNGVPNDREREMAQALAGQTIWLATKTDRIQIARADFIGTCFGAPPYSSAVILAEATIRAVFVDRTASLYVPVIGKVILRCIQARKGNLSMTSRRPKTQVSHLRLHGLHLSHRAGRTLVLRNLKIGHTFARYQYISSTHRHKQCPVATLFSLLTFLCRASYRAVPATATSDTKFCMRSRDPFSASVSTFPCRFASATIRRSIYRCDKEQWDGESAEASVQ